MTNRVRPDGVEVSSAC